MSVQKDIKLIVGIGNYAQGIGINYDSTKHNAGIVALEYLSKEFGVNLRLHPTLLGRYGESSKLKGVFLYHPYSLMNIIGKNVSIVVKSKGFIPSNILVLHDELELQPGQCKFRHKQSFRGHNGLKSISNSLKSDDFKRIGIGIGRPISRAPEVVAEYVLSKFTRSDYKSLEEEAFPSMVKEIKEKFLI